MLWIILEGVIEYQRYLMLFKWGSVSFQMVAKILVVVNVEIFRFLNGFSFKLSLIEMFFDNDLKRIS